MNIMDYIRPELLPVALVCYIIGMGLKASSIRDKFIPFVLGAVGVILSTIYVLATSDFLTVQDGFLAAFTGIVQGILLAGASTYVNQLIKQAKEKEDEK